MPNSGALVASLRSANTGASGPAAAYFVSRGIASAEVWVSKNTMPKGSAAE